MYRNFFRKVDFENRQAIQKTGPMQIQECGFLCFDMPVFAKIELKLAPDRSLKLVQLEAVQLAIKIVLNRSLADALGERSDSGADFDAQKGFAHDCRIALAEQGDC